MMAVIGYLFLAVVAGLVLAFVVTPVLASLFSLFVAVFPIPKVPLTYNLRNLQVRWLTAVVTSIAIVLVVALMTFMLAFVKGMDRLTEGSGKPGNILIFADGATDEAFSRLEPYGVQQLPQEMQELIAKTPEGDYLFSREVFVVVTTVGVNPETGVKKRRFCQMRGIDDPRIASAVHEVELMDVGGQPSRWFAPTGEKEVVLGNGVAKAFGKDVGKETLAPGDTVLLGTWEWKVVGVMSPSSASTFGSEIWVHDRIVQDNFGRANSYSSFVVRIKDPTKTRQAAQALKTVGTTSFTVIPEREHYAKMSQTNDQFRVACYFVAVVMAIGGVLGVMITMFAAVSQRARDIGVLRLLGFARWQILSSFMLETLAIGLLGGVLGVAIGSLSNGVTVSSIVSSSSGGGKSVVLQMSVDSMLMIAGVLFALVMSAIGGFIPAVFAMRLRPLESLR